MTTVHRLCHELWVLILTSGRKASSNAPMDVVNPDYNPGWGAFTLQTNPGGGGGGSGGESRLELQCK